MTDERQIVVPASFLQLYTPKGRVRPTPPREWLEQRHDLCEDLCSLLQETVKEKMWTLGITQEDALERVALGLAELPLELNELEATWIKTRLQEMLET